MFVRQPRFWGWYILAYDPARGTTAHSDTYQIEPTEEQRLAFATAHGFQPSQVRVVPLSVSGPGTGALVPDESPEMDIGS